jgi:hypothetical protein
MVELREPLDTLITGPSRSRPAPAFPRAKEIRLYDTTLRDGEQTPGVAFTPEQKYELAVMLSDAGVHILDMGFPSAAPSERRALELILEGKRKGAIRGPRDHVMCRSNARDIDVTIDASRAWARRPTTAPSSSSRPAPTSTSSTRSARRCSRSKGEPRGMARSARVVLSRGQHPDVV